MISGSSDRTQKKGREGQKPSACIADMVYPVTSDQGLQEPQGH